MPLGQLCRQCQTEIEKRAARIGHLVALVSSAGVTVYVLSRLTPGDTLGRNVGIAGIAVWFILSNMVVRRIVREWLS